VTVRRTELGPPAALTVRAVLDPGVRSAGPTGMRGPRWRYNA
jgi:hypothetical protein